MLIPWNTDAPVYHFPWATIGLIVVNTFVFVQTSQFEVEEVEPWILVFGDGLHPAQWLSNAFIHADIWHLLGNMIFLWSFGLVVEGKLGWLRFLFVCLGICLVDGFLVQLVMLGGEGGALGASGAIYGLLAIAMIWAPRNEFSCVLLLGRFPTFDLPILSFAIGYLLLQLVMAGVGGFSMSSEMLHLTGAGIGAVIGVGMLRAGLVDCEGWDLLAVMGDRVGKSSPARNVAQSVIVEKQKQEPEMSEDRIADALRQIQTFLAQNNSAAAAALDKKMGQLTSKWLLPEDDLKVLIKKLLQEQHWQTAIDPMVQYLRRFPEKAAPVRLKLAQILLVDQQRPYKTLEVLERIPVGALSPEQEKLRIKLKTEAERQCPDADLEIEGEQW